MLNVVEAFSGIGSQAKALQNLHIDYKISSIIEWEVNALYAYDIIHNGNQNLKDYRFHSKESIVEELSRYNLSTNGKDPLDEYGLTKMPLGQLKSILASIERTNNLIDISSVLAQDLPDDIDVLTYSFPCQDLSISSHWHHNFSGIDRDANNRSGLLWQVERLLKDYCNVGKPLPKFLLMENVSAILSKRHIGNFQIWQNFLEEIGYVNQVYTLNAKNFYVPQNRERAYMISILTDHDEEKNQAISSYFFENNLEQVSLYSNSASKIENYLRLDYSNPVYKQEAINSTPKYTPSREKIFRDNKILAIDQLANNEMIASTVTTKQDRNPNAGIIEYKDIQLVENAKYRNLTPRECFLLMGFEESDFDLLLENNFAITRSRKMIADSKLYKLAGNSIVVPVLEAIFKQISDVKEIIEKDSCLSNIGSHAKVIK